MPLGVTVSHGVMAAIWLVLVAVDFEPSMDARTRQLDPTT